MIHKKQSLVDQQQLFAWLLRYLRILGLAPYVRVDGKYKKSQVLHGLSVSWRVIASVLTFVAILASPKFATSDIFYSLSQYWEPVMCLTSGIFSWHLLMSSTRLIRILNCLNLSKTNSQPVGFVTLVIFGIHLITLGYVIVAHSQGVENDWLHLISALNFVTNYSLNFSSALFLSIVMQLFTSEFCNIADVQLTSIFINSYSRDEGLSSSLSFLVLGSPTSDNDQATKRKVQLYKQHGCSAKLSKNSLDRIRRKLIFCNGKVSLIHSHFSMTVFCILAYEQLNTVMIVLYAMYQESSSS
ncbi:Gustatory receptor 52, partial [Hyalella azteca]